VDTEEPLVPPPINPPERNQKWWRIDVRATNAWNASHVEKMVLLMAANPQDAGAFPDNDRRVAIDAFANQHNIPRNDERPRPLRVDPLSNVIQYTLFQPPPLVAEDSAEFFRMIDESQYVSG
jgi:hypothetical protein